MTIAKRRVEGSSAQESFAFGFKVTPKAFQLMIAQLYKDRIAAFVRELSTNAYEAHQMVGTESKPFDVSIPTMMNPVFKIRDYGPGLSVEQVRSIYTMLFESTKSESNDMGGCFGLGSKSPFAYDDNIQFAVTSFFNGKKYMYSVYKNEIGFPHMDLMQTVDTTEPNGVEVSIPINRNDFQKVEHSARNVYRWFNTVPNVTNSSNKFKSAIPTLVGKQYKIFLNDIQGPHAKMGNIVYPIDSKLCKLHGLERSQIMFEFPIGALTPEPSREGLSYDRKTINAIEIAAKTAITEMVATIQPKIDTCQDFYDACITGLELIVGTPIQISQIQYKGENLRNELGYLNDKVGIKKNYNNNKLCVNRYSSYNYIRPIRNVLFYVIDKKCHHNMMIKSDIEQYIANKNVKPEIYICDVAYHKQDLDVFCKTFRILPSRVKAVSTIAYTAPKRGSTGVPSKKHKTRVMEFTPSRNRLDCWIDSSVDVDTDSGFYVEVHNNYIVVDATNNKVVHPSELDQLINLIGYKGKVYGVKKSALDKVKTNKKWTNFLDKAKTDCYNLMSTVDLDSVKAAKKCLSEAQYQEGGCIKTFLDVVKAKKIALKSVELNLAINILNQLQTLSAIDVSVFERVNKSFFSGSIIVKTTNTSSVKSDTYDNVVKQIVKKYPMFGYFRPYNFDEKLVVDFVEYVNLKG